MTRKRFIKLLMSYGYSRNEAVCIAEKTTIPYKNAIVCYRVVFTWQMTTKWLAEGVKICASTFEDFRNAYKKRMRGDMK